MVSISIVVVLLVFVTFYISRKRHLGEEGEEDNRDQAGNREKERNRERERNRDKKSKRDKKNNRGKKR